MFYHESNGRVYGPSNPGETLADYRKRCKRAYGSLSGLKFGRKEDFHPIHWSR